jgi:uncharacterized membrane protein
MIAGSTPDKVLAELRGHSEIKVLQTSLSSEAEAKLRDALATPSREETLEKAG